MPERVCYWWAPAASAHRPAICMAKVGFRDITVMDFDIIEEHNIPNQFLPCTPGAFKVDGLHDLMHAMIPEGSEYAFSYHSHLFDEEVSIQPYTVFISAVDSMTVRQIMWDRVLNESDLGTLFVDARMGVDTMQLYLVDLLNEDAIDFYQTTLFPEEEAEEIPCTSKASMYLSLVIAGMLTNAVTKFFMGHRVPTMQIVNLRTGCWLKDGPMNIRDSTPPWMEQAA